LKEVYIVGAVRTAIGDFGGGLKDVSALELGKTCMEEVVKRAGIKKEDVEQVIMGNVLPAGLGQNPARQASLMAGLPFNSGAITVNKVCGSGLKAAMLADQAIKTDDADIILAGGMENMYRSPYLLPGARGGYRMSDNKVIDSLIHDGLWDIMRDYHMGITAENVAGEFKVTREDQDRFSLDSYRKAQKAWAAGQFKAEIVPVPVPSKKGPTWFERDEACQRETSMEALGKLPTAFKKEGGTVTAGNSSKISDGAAALILASADKVKKLGLKPLARVVAHGAQGIDPRIMVAAPINSIPFVLKRAGLQEKDIDLHEINEAFASSTVAVIRHLKIDEGKVNIRGGAVALGHPIGCSGARLVVTLINALKDEGKKMGMVTLCLGGGEAVTMIIERV